MEGLFMELEMGQKSAAATKYRRFAEANRKPRRRPQRQRARGTTKILVTSQPKPANTSPFFTLAIGSFKANGTQTAFLIFYASPDNMTFNLHNSFRSQQRSQDSRKNAEMQN